MAENEEVTLDSGINVGVRLLILGLFSGAIFLLKVATVINFRNFYFFDAFFTSYLFWLCIKNQISCYFKGGYAYLKGYVYCFFQNVPGGTFIQGATSIPESRVGASDHFGQKTTFDPIFEYHTYENFFEL